MNKINLKATPQNNTSIKNVITEVTGFQLTINEQEFGLFKKLIYDKAGISLSDSKRSLVVSRLSKRMRELAINSFDTYFRIVTAKDGQSELQHTIDLLTTNETYFFREERHFDYLKQEILPAVKLSAGYSVWSAASSTGEEAYTTAMVIADSLGLSSNWKITGTDINSDVILQARRALYPITEKGKIEKHYLAKYCLKGVRAKEGMLLIDEKLKKHVSFESLNLIGVWQKYFSEFDLVLLRNVMIYFDRETKQRLVDRIANSLKLGGYLFIGHSETINKITDRFEIVQPSVYQKIK